MASGERELTHNEIWDDSALINSWDEALEEYKKYHSIHKNGGNVKDLLKLNDENSSDAKLNLQEINESSTHENVETDSAMRHDNLDDGQETNNVASHGSQARASGAPPTPAGLLSTIRDEGLKKLLMSWYYAGYYTGYYEGQRDFPRS
jgi:hypothetical protein